MSWGMCLCLGWKIMQMSLELFALNIVMCVEFDAITICLGQSASSISTIDVSVA
jgi:hypothetical protein